MNYHAPAPIGFDPPASRVQAEQGLFGAILTNNEAMDIALQHVTADDFEEEIHRAFFLAMTEKRLKGERIDPTLLTSVLGNYDLGGITVRGYLRNMFEEAVTVIGCRDYAREIKRGAQLRHIYSLLHATLPMVSVPNADPVLIAGDIISALDEVAQGETAETAKRVSVGHAAQSVLDRIEEVQCGRGGNIISYGLRSLDDMTGGLRDGTLVTLAGRPSMGKTTAAIHSALEVAKAGHGVYFVSLEMSAAALAERCISALCFDQMHPIHYNRIEKGTGLDRQELSRIKAASDKLASLPLSIEQQCGLSIAQITARARQVASRFERDGIKLKVIVVDHLGLIKDCGRSDNRTQQVTAMTASLKALSKEMGVAVVMLCQLNRGVESRDDKRPQLHDLRDSGSIEQDSDVVITVFREAYYLSKKTDLTEEENGRLAFVRDSLELAILKNRQGPTGMREMFCSIANNYIAEF